MVFAFRRPSAALLFACVAFVHTAFALYDAEVNFRDVSSIPDRRTNLCGLTGAMQNGSVGLEDVLRGLHLSFVTPLYDAPWFDEPVNNTDPHKMTGFHLELLEALADRAGFTYTVHSHPLAAFEPEMSWTDYLQVAVQKYDVSMDWWLATNERSKLGIRAPLSFLDLSLVPVTYAKDKEDGLEDILWRVSLPFTPGLWAMLFGLSIATSLLYVAAEANLEESDFNPNSSKREKVLRGLWLGFVQFTGAGGFEPRTKPGHVLVLTYSFVILLSIAAYTANLAAHLTVEAYAVPCQSMDKCLGKGVKTCVRKGTIADEVMSRKFPENVRTGQVVRCETDPWECARSKKCSLVVQPLMLYELDARNIDYNEECTMKRVGGNHLAYFGGGWMCNADHSHKCTALLADALASHMLALQISGELDKLIDSLYDYSSHSCSADADEKENSEQLTVKSMSGALVIHGVAWVASLVFLLFKRAQKEKQPSDIETAPESDANEADPTQRDDQAILLAMQAMQKDFAKVVASLEVRGV